MSGCTFYHVRLYFVDSDGPQKQRGLWLLHQGLKLVESGSSFCIEDSVLVGFEPE